MGTLVDEVKLWNTPIIGAFLLWRFTQGYCDNHQTGDAPIGLLHFVASAILISKELMKPISNKRANLQSYVRSFENTKNSDILISLQQQIIDKREYTLAAIDIATAEGLLVWDAESGKLYPRNLSKRPGRGKKLNVLMVREGKKAEILGKWFSEHDISSIESYLKVVF
ncbi:MAG: DUF6521 family protein [Paludibacter sp.]|nr:DUF6521 family protein [Paludibacter sp.]